MTQEEMAHRLGISPRAWQDHELGRTAPKAHVFASLCAEGFDGHWLLTGRGAIRPPPARAGPAGRGWNGEPAAALIRHREAFFPPEEVQVAVGLGEAAYLLEALRVDPAQVSLQRAASDAMAPLLHWGDWVLVDRTAARCIGEGIYAIGLQHVAEPLFRRLQPIPGGRLLALCDNPLYRAFEFLPGEEADVVGQVVWIGRRL